ncbi:MAG TPA: bifunctional pyr operon transcriptional regulator/uracil phosphoribosyltransferase PyrR [Acidimicrobiia bacterium]|nr:bifunctional pyr operon transcriptional regulator/uracil phosphoribosyltransferase PyrR [Acidimicrobiia bacterium]
MDAEDVGRALRRIAHEIVERHRGVADVVLVGIHSRGVPLAHRIGAVVADLEAHVPVGEIDIALYRDDLDRRPRTKVGPTSVPGGIDDRDVVLVDDVLYTGRTVRAALDALADLGRPRGVELAVLVDRGHRELPIRADYVGKNLPTSAEQRVSVRVAERDDEDAVVIEEVGT